MPIFQYIDKISVFAINYKFTEVLFQYLNAKVKAY